jgi:predicted Zn-dependent protease
VTLGWGVYPGRETKGASYAYGAILINPTIKISNRPALIEHELGHAFGIGHSGSVDDIMHDPMTAARPSLADARRVCQHWGEP